MKIILYGGPNCCLCEDAMHLINSLDVPQLDVQKVNVKESPELFHLYGARIPVVKMLSNNTELAWPFDQTQLQAFLSGAQ
jgi:hypothetical protein